MQVEPICTLEGLTIDLTNKEVSMLEIFLSGLRLPPLGSEEEEFFHNLKQALLDHLAAMHKGGTHGTE